MSESLHAPSDAPAVNNASDGDPGITTAVTLKFAVVGNIVAVRFYGCNAANTGVWVAYVWEVTALDSAGPAGTLLASKTLGFVPAGAAWNNVTLDSPVPTDPAKLYRVGIHSERYYVATNGAYATSKINGNITAYANDTSGISGYAGSLKQGTFRVSASPALYPDSTGAAADYFVDVVWEADGEEPAGLAVTVWNGTTELPATLSVWNGASELAATVDSIAT